MNEIERENPAIPAENVDEQPDEREGTPESSVDPEEEQAVDAIRDLVIDTEITGASSIAIDRMSPLWCAGHVATVPIDMCPTVDELKASYGGHKFRVRVLSARGKQIVQRQILISDIPRIDGNPIRNLQTPEKVPVPAQPSSETAALSALVQTLLVQQQQANARHQQFMERMLFEGMNNGAPESTADRLGELAETLEAVKSFMPATPAEGGGAEAWLPLADKILDQLNSKKQERQERAARPRPAPAKVVYRNPARAPLPPAAPPPLAAPPPAAPPPAAPPPAAPPPAAPPPAAVDEMPEQAIEEVDESSIPQRLELDELGDELAAAVDDDLDGVGLILRGLLADMPPSKQMRLAKIVTGELKPDVDKKTGGEP